MTAETFIGGERIVLAKPQTYMNLSGESIKELLGRYRATAADLVVLYDDLDIPQGNIRGRASGSAGTHNGMRNIVSEIGTTAFARIRIGIGKQNSEIALIDYVLSDVRKADMQLLDDALDNAACAAAAFCRGEKTEDIMQKYNRKG